MADFSSSSDGRGYSTRLVVNQVGQDIAGNFSVVNAKLYLINTTTTFSEYSCRATIAINGTDYNWSGSPSILGRYSTTLIHEVTVNVPHNADGTKAIIVASAFTGGGGWSPGELYSGNQTFGLSTIARASTVSASGGSLGDAPVSISINRASDAFKHTLKYIWGNKSGTIATGVDTSYSWNLPLDFLNAIPDTSNGRGTIFVDTYNGNTLIGTNSTGFNVSVSSKIKPTFSGLNLTDMNSTANSLISGNNFLQIISKIKVDFNNPQGAYGSTITGYRAEIVGQNIATNTNGGWLEMLQFKGNAVIRASVLDSRGVWSDTKDISINVLEYFSPLLSFEVSRSGTGKKIFTINRRAKIAPLTVNGIQKNSMTLSFRVKETNSSTATEDKGPAAGSWSSISELNNSPANLAGNYIPSKSFTVYGTLSDKFTSTDFKAVVSSETVVLSYDKSGVGVNKIRENGALDVGGAIFSNGLPIQHYQFTGDTGGSVLNAQNDANTLLNPGYYYMRDTALGLPIKDWGNMIIFSPQGASDTPIKEPTQIFLTKNGAIYIRTHNYSSIVNDWMPWRIFVAAKRLGWTSTGVDGVFYKRQDDIVYLKINKEVNSTDTLNLGKIPLDKELDTALMFEAQTWGFSASSSRNLQINANGTVYLLSGVTGTYKTQISWMI